MKWYRTSIVKTILIGIAHVAAVILMVAAMWVMAFPSAVNDIVQGTLEEEYLDSAGFEEKLWLDSTDILNNIVSQQSIMVDGKLDLNQIVDVQEFSNTGEISGENVHGLSYTMEELAAWRKAVENYECRSNLMGYEEMPQAIIVCQKLNGEYDYYYYGEFEQMVLNGELRLIMPADGYTEEEALDALYNGEYYGYDEYGEYPEGFINVILDKDGNEKYNNCWRYDGIWMEEMFAPQGAESILDIVNANPEWNGRLTDAFEMIFSVGGSLNESIDNVQNYKNVWKEGNTNLSYIYADLTTKELYTNRSDYKDYKNLNISLTNMQSLGRYVFVRPTLEEFTSNLTHINEYHWFNHVSSYNQDESDFVFAVAVNADLPIADSYQDEAEAYDIYIPYMKIMVALAIISASLILIAIIWLTMVAGKHPEDEEIHLHPWDKWKTEIAVVIVCSVWVALLCLLVSLLESMCYSYDIYTQQYVYRAVNYDKWELVVAGGIGFVTCSAFLIGYLSLVRRIKAKILWKNSLLRTIWNWTRSFVKHAMKHLPTMWKLVIACGVIFFIQFIGIFMSTGIALIVILVTDLLIFGYVLIYAIGRRKIRKGIGNIANGDVNYKIPLTHLYGEQRIIAEMVNHIGEGLQAAVEESMKSERLKTDLITNVSHDIKTPLTSIINYIDLLKRENFTDPKVQGYLEVLEEKAQRLKTLTEDVVEASKVSSGNITLECMNLNLVEMIQQTSGEFEEKFKKRGLKEVLNLPEAEAIIYADGRRIWRVLENIYNNAAKYAMEGTRIYADLRVTANEVIFSLKNISEQPLNIEASELTERFIRGDVSRSTEGSGLGLSIASNLTQMQGGKFELYLDGDLFKVTITFPKVK